MSQTGGQAWLSAGASFSLRGRLVRRWAGLALLIAICLPLLGCPQPPPPALGLKIVDVVREQPTDGDPDRREKITVTWSYDTPGRLKRQVIRLHSMNFDGGIFSLTRGCLPEELLSPGEAVGECLPLDKVSHTFRFPGPSTFHVFAIDDADNRFEKFVKLTIPNLTVRLSVVAATDPNYPRLPQQRTDEKSAGEIVFEKAFGVFSVDDAQGDDPRINGLTTDPQLAVLFSPGNVFYFESNAPVEEQNNNAFAATRGAQFPSLPNEFLGSPGGAQFRNVRSLADVVILALGVGVEGTIETLKSKSGDVQVITGKLQPLFPIIVQVDVRSSQDGTNTLFCADMHLGNVAQGLGIAAFRNHVSPVVKGTLGTCQTQFLQVPGFGPGTNGGADGVVAGLVLTTRTGDVLNPAQVQFNLRWTNVPLFSENDLTGFFNSQFATTDF
jgi:hypothetical protein